MKARLPKGMGGGGPQNMQAMLKQAQKMQELIEQKKAELEEKEYVVSSGGGMVEVTMTGKHEVKAIGINPEVVDPEDVEMLEDMLVAALNEANRQIDEEAEREMDSATGGLNIPGL
ncbi:MAG: YbaB/EbfC family nucleoid-associated protein [Eubacterium sp.]|nr:YbaB/EbfC family nucleoid-associated protein [Eubacterium sp.]